MTIEFTEESGALRLAGELTVYHAAEVKRPLMAMLQEKTELEIDLSGISEIDTAGLQLLMLAKKEADRSQKNLRLVSHSAPVLELMDLYDLAGFFGDPLVITAAPGPRGGMSS
ncbi:STAS domain-containing protein [Methylocaldum sp.]|uniref:STAS domain-containing protein n=1 Tax=Methylocaldum sp. TaxID=1969727 RepID=UPI002D4FA6FB|nr:STAS domain-containing protein [Methylocaldum sp.]HYE38112.1 STAS domain-containing protein [Methylocaldum sp.]